MQYIYHKYLPFGESGRLAHLEADSSDTPFRFVGVRRSRQGFTMGATKALEHGMRCFITSLSLEDEILRGHLAALNGCAIENVEIRGPRVRERRGGIPDSSEYEPSRWEMVGRVAVYFDGKRR